MKTLKNIIITAIFLLISIVGNAQSKQISLSVKNAPIKEVFAEIQQKSGYRILYNDEVVADELRVSVKATNQSVKDILTQMLASTKLTFVLHSDDLIIVTREDLLNKSIEIFGRIADENNQPVEFANVILYEANNPDRIKQGCVSNAQGSYKLVNLLPGNYKIKVSFVGYETLMADISIDNRSEKTIKRDFQLKANIQNLDEVVVEGERRVLTAEAGKLVFYMPTLLKNKSATNAYEALKEIPGVMEQNEQIALLGTSGTTVLIDGKKANMTTAQLMSLLRSIPLSRLENVELMYSVPPQYNIRGSAINVILKQQSDNAESLWQGEVAGEFRNRYYPGGEGRVSVVYLGKQTVVDALYSYGNFRSLNKEILESEHTLKGTVYPVFQESGGINKYQIHNTRLALQHKFSNKDKIDFSYVGMFDLSTNDRTATTKIEGVETDTKTYKSGPSFTHNFKADYSTHFGLNLGADFTLFNVKKDYSVQNVQLPSSALTEKLIYQSKQKIHRTMFYANQSHQLKNNWSIDYGINYSGANTKNLSIVEQNGSSYDEASFDTWQREHIWNFFAGLSKSFSKKLSVQASLAAEYYNAKETSKGETKELWNDVAWFPTLNASYNASPDHMFQFAVSSDKTYPPYWSLNPNNYYIGYYSLVLGNPHLRPQRDYGVGLTYIYKQKYIIRSYLNYIPDYFTQLPYQSREKLQQEFIEQNFTYRQNIGLMGIVWFNIGRRISSRLVANAMYWREKDDEFFDISFDRKTIMTIFNMNNDITLSAKPDIKMNISGYVAPFGGIQGIYDLGASGNLSSSLMWTFDKDRARLILKADDIFNTRTPTASIDYKGQKSILKAYRYTRTFSILFVYRFGGYKEREREEIDTSRFGTK